MKTPEQLAEEYAKEHHMGGWEYEASIPAWLAGYLAAHEKLEQQIQFLELQLREANTRAIRLEAEKQ